MDVWAFRGYSNDYTLLTAVDDDDVMNDTFIADGTPMHWPVRPRAEPILAKSKKKQQPLADISCMVPGHLILSQAAYDALKDFLSPFGQFLEVECLNAGGLLGDDAIHSQIRYFYNVTNIIPCIDYENSEKIGSGVSKPAFFPEATPKDLQVFKDPLRKRVEIYLSSPAKARLEQLIADAQLTGAVLEQVA